MRNGLIAIEGPPGVGKESLARYLSERRGARFVPGDSTDNPFLKDFQRDSRRYAFATQMSFINSRYQLLKDLRQRDLFHDLVITDFTWQRNFIYANLFLSEDELTLFDNIVNQFQRNIPQPDLVIYLQSEAQLLNRRGSGLSTHDLGNLVEAYNHYFFHLKDIPTLIVSDFNLSVSMEDIDSYLDNDINGTVYLTKYRGLF